MPSCGVGRSALHNCGCFLCCGSHVLRLRNGLSCRLGGLRSFCSSRLRLSKQGLSCCLLDLVGNLLGLRNSLRRLLDSLFTIRGSILHVLRGVLGRHLLLLLGVGRHGRCNRSFGLRSCQCGLYSSLRRLLESLFSIRASILRFLHGLRGVLGRLLLLLLGVGRHGRCSRNVGLRSCRCGLCCSRLSLDLSCIRLRVGLCCRLFGGHFRRGLNGRRLRQISSWLCHGSGDGGLRGGFFVGCGGHNDGSVGLGHPLGLCNIHGHAGLVGAGTAAHGGKGFEELVGERLEEARKA
mmetsp:Transcript_103121/g.330631  ORF Transcript_103121/g.330631 Transcript_103121/m.330631 type:complete len:293 (+) Transcript_103121:688-1566(+)